MRFFRVLKKGIGMSLSQERAYKWNFYVKAFASTVADFVGPLLTLLIYSSSEGIPGWGFYEFLLFQGTLILVFGLGHTFTLLFPYDVIRSVREGEFDKYLVKPLNTMLYIFATTFEMEGIPEVLVGMLITGFCMFKLGISVFSLNFLAYVVLIAAAFFAQAAVMVLVSSLSFIVVNSDALMMLYFKISDFIRYPLNVYTVGIKFFLTFMLPLAVASFYPATVLIQGATAKIMAMSIIPVIIFTIVAVLFWNYAMKKYTSAGG